MYWDVLLIGALLCGVAFIYAVSRWITHENRLQAIQREIDAIPEMSYDMGVTLPKANQPRDPRVSMQALPDRQLMEMREFADRRRLMLVVGNSSERVH